jgi:pilus assembly protein CpaF
VVVIEDTAELRFEQPNVVRFEARREQPGLPAVTIRDLVKATLRHRPDRILVGEVRGAEAFDLLQALNTGHSGSLATIHANTATQAISRLASCVLQSDIQLPFHAIRSSIADSINLLLHLERRNGGRSVAELVEVDGYDQPRDRFEFKSLYRAA